MMLKPMVIVLSTALTFLLLNCSKESLTTPAISDGRIVDDGNENDKICTELYADDHSRAFGQASTFWSKNTLRVRFLGGSARVRAKVMQYASHWSQHADIKFEFVDQEPSDIRIGFDQNSGSWSYVGRTNNYISPNRTTMNFGWFTDRTSDTEFRRTTLHEFGHAIGLSHEHQHPEVDINWNREAVYTYYRRTQDWSRSEVDGNIFRKYSNSTTNYSAYDPSSIMHYYIPRSLVSGTWTSQWNTNLSETDISFIRSIYPKNEDDEDPIVESGCQCPTGGIAVACEDFEGISQSSLDQNEQWKRWSPSSSIGELQTYSWGSVLKVAYAQVGNPDVVYQPGVFHSGSYALSWDLYVGQQSTAYFNMQKQKIPGTEFGAQVFFNGDETGRVEVNNRQISFDYDQNRWLGIQLRLDFDQDLCFLLVDDVSMASWPISWTARNSTGNRQFAGLNFYAVDGDSKFWLDDFCVSKITPMAMANISVGWESLSAVTNK
jgi:hypothetical protein